MLRWLHIVSLVWGVLTEVLPWPCPLTLLENWLESRAGVQPYEGGFLLHYLDKLVYPNIPAGVLTAAGVVVCVLNLALYARQGWLTIRDREPGMYFESAKDPIDFGLDSDARIP